VAVNAAGWTSVTWPTCSGDAPLTCVEDWLATAGGALALANLLYAAVYRRVFVTASTQPRRPGDAAGAARQVRGRTGIRLRGTSRLSA
jgi:hypothetical protein